MKRVICLAGVLGIIRSAGAEWGFEEFADAFTGDSTFMVSTASAETFESVAGESEHAFLQLRCDEERGAAYWRLVWPTLLVEDVNYNPFLGATVDSRMQIRFDDGRIYGPGTLVGGWPIDEPVGPRQSTSNMAVGAVLNRALDADVMMVRDYSWDGKQLTATFNLEGLEGAVERLSEHCRRL